MTAKELVDICAEILDSKKAEDLTVIKTEEQTILSDYFLIASGTGSVHVRALADDLEEELKKRHGILPKGVEGRATGWVLLDYGTVLVHIFTPDQREYYNIERLWVSDIE